MSARVMVFRLDFCKEFFVTSSQALAKASVIMFYQRVFTRASKRFWLALMLTHGLNILWWLGTLLLQLFICFPVARNWDSSVDGTCQENVLPFVLPPAVGLVLVDLIILLIPVHIIRRLQMNRGQKFRVIGVFCLGYW